MPLQALETAPLSLIFAIFLCAGVVVWFAGVRLTRALDAISRKTGLGQALVGMLLLGGITSLPELANVLTASIHGVPDLAVNNLLGSAAINILLLAVADAVIGRDALTSVVAKPVTMMMGALCMLVLALVCVAITVGDISVFGIGPWSVAICAASIGSFLLAARYSERAPWALKSGERKEKGADESPPRESLSRLIVVAAVTGALIFFCGYALSVLGDTLAEQTGLGAGFVGFFLIGLSTSMPELSSIVTALKLRRYEMAFGQVLGTNFVNLSLFVVADIAYRGGPVINELGQFEVLSALLGLILIGIFQIGLLERRNLVVLRAGYDSAAVIVLFLGGACLLYMAR